MVIFGNVVICKNCILNSIIYNTIQQLGISFSIPIVPLTENEIIFEYLFTKDVYQL